MPKTTRKALCKITRPHNGFNTYIGISQGDIVLADIPVYKSAIPTHLKTVRIEPVITQKQWSDTHVFVMLADLEEIPNG
jgi:hypothetical protein